MIVARQAVSGKRCREPRPRRDKRIQPRVSTGFQPWGPDPLTTMPHCVLVLRRTSPRGTVEVIVSPAGGTGLSPGFQPWESSTKTDAP
jgi:hypothetical protein